MASGKLVPAVTMTIVSTPSSRLSASRRRRAFVSWRSIRVTNIVRRHYEIFCSESSPSIENELLFWMRLFIGGEFMLTRREAIMLSMAAYISRSNPTLAATTQGFNDQLYAGAMVIDALGGPGSNDPRVPEGSPLSARDIAD